MFLHPSTESIYDLIVAVGRVLYAVRLLTCLYLVLFNLHGDNVLKCPSLQHRTKLVLLSYRSAHLRIPATKQNKHGVTIAALPFNTAVTIPAYFALCCDVHSNLGPVLLQHSHGGPVVLSYTREELSYIGTSLFPTSMFTYNTRVASQLKFRNIYNALPCLRWDYNRYGRGIDQHIYGETNNISVRISARKNNLSIQTRRRPT